MINGYFVLNKPANMTSAGAIARVKKILPKGNKIGHTGTLDPNVTGVLAVALGQATKTIPYLNMLADSNKKYRASMEFGFMTDTLDIWGEVIERADIPEISRAKIDEVLCSMTGRQSQIPPMYSALKKNGVRLYDLAREGIVVEREAREIEIFGFEHVNYEGGVLSFDVTCSKGTYVRSLCSDIAQRLGTLGTMNALKRLKSDCFDLSMAVDLEDLSEEFLTKKYRNINQVFFEFPAIELNFEYAVHVLNGVKVNLNRFAQERGVALEDEMFRILYNGKCIALAKRFGGEIRTVLRLCAAVDLAQ